MKKMLRISIFIIVVSIFIVFKYSYQIEGILEEYPNILKAFVALFTLLTTVISLVIAYKSYDNSVKQQEKKDKEKNKQFEENSDRIINSLKSDLAKYTRKINVFRLGYTNSDVEFSELAKELSIKSNLEEIEKKLTSQVRSSKSTELAKMDEVNIVNLHTASDSALFLFDIYENTSRENDETFEKEIIKELNKICNIVFYTS
jgi:multisubunit Na+/H+ antiporter MnhG subunit